VQAALLWRHLLQPRALAAAEAADDFRIPGDACGSTPAPRSAVLMVSACQGCQEHTLWIQLASAQEFLILPKDAKMFHCVE